MYVADYYSGQGFRRISLLRNIAIIIINKSRLMLAAVMNNRDQFDSEVSSYVASFYSFLLNVHWVNIAFLMISMLKNKGSLIIYGVWGAEGRGNRHNPRESSIFA